MMEGFVPAGDSLWTAVSLLTQPTVADPSALKKQNVPFFFRVDGLSVAKSDHEPYHVNPSVRMVLREYHRIDFSKILYFLSGAGIT